MRISLKQYCTQNGYNNVSRVRANVKNLKFVTLIDSGNGALSENLYLGKRYAELVEVGQFLPIADLFVTEVMNEGGEMRMKLTDSSGAVSAAKLEDFKGFDD